MSWHSGLDYNNYDFVQVIYHTWAFYTRQIQFGTREVNFAGALKSKVEQIHCTCAIVPSSHHSIFIHCCGEVLNAVVSIIVRNAIIVFLGIIILFERKLTALSPDDLPFAIVRNTGGFNKGPLSNMALLIHLCCTVRPSTIRQRNWILISDAFVVHERKNTTLSIFQPSYKLFRVQRKHHWTRLDSDTIVILWGIRHLQISLAAYTVLESKRPCRSPIAIFLKICLVSLYRRCLCWVSVCVTLRYFCFIFFFSVSFSSISSKKKSEVVWCIYFPNAF